MFANWHLITISFVYIGLLFGIAFVGDKYRHKMRGRQQSWIYALTLGVYCTSWSFLGTTGQAADSILSYLPIYLGPILLFAFAWPFLQRMIQTSLKLNLTSIADLLAARFGNSRHLATLVTVVALIGILPYIALQLKAMVHSLQLLQAGPSFSHWFIGLLITLALAGFIVIFGIRQLDITERHPGVMLAIAFESLVKLVAFLCVGVFTCFVLFDSPWALFVQAEAQLKITQQWQTPNILSSLGLTIICMAAFLCLPRQFHVMVVELKLQKYSFLSRRIFPIYLLIFATLSAPMGLAGHMLLNGNVPADAYVLFLPAQKSQYWLSLFAFIGAISAASSMVIVSSIALSTMVSNEIVFPLLYRKSSSRKVDFYSFRADLLRIRRALVILIVLLGYSMFLIAPSNTLGSLGEISFGAIAQLTPALLAAFYFRTATLTGVYSGICTGFVFWVLLSLLPQLQVYDAPFAGMTFTSTTSGTYGTLLALLVNILTTWIVSYFSRQSVQERVQVKNFFSFKWRTEGESLRKKNIHPNEFELLVSRFVGKEKAKQSFKVFYQQHSREHMPLEVYNSALLQHTTSTLASVMGASSAQLVISSALEGRDIGLDDVATFVEDASSQRRSFSRDLLRNAIENVSEGISVVDSELNLVAWNRKYEEMFDYPAELLYPGCNVENLIRFNARRGMCGPGEVEEQVSKRLAYLRKRSPHSSERQYRNGRTIRIEGNPLPSGGFVMLFSDITAYRRAEKVLKDANLDLETLVTERTEKLELANKELARANAAAAEANQKKSRYLHACSHDLMQPLEAARLFASALAEQQSLNSEQSQHVSQIQHSLKIANDLLSDLSEIARIEGGKIQPTLTEFCLQHLFDSLQQEFIAASKERQVEFTVVGCSAWVRSDLHMLHRILQNLIGNAFRYASPGKVLLGCRRSDSHLDIFVIDNGPGIPTDKQTQVFQQFVQLDNNTANTPKTENKAINKGLGLGLNISHSLCDALSHPFRLTSQEGNGCQFSIQVPRVAATTPPIQQAPPVSTIQGVHVLCVDNDPDVLMGMIALLETWDCNVQAAGTWEEAVEIIQEDETPIDIMLVDYQLDDDTNGLDLMLHLRKLASQDIPGILVTANSDNHIVEKAQKHHFGYLRKLIRPGQLRALMSAKLAEALQRNYSSTQ